MSCSSGWYDVTFYGNNTFGSLVPSKLAGCTSTTESDSAVELATILQITMLTGLTFLVFVMYRSCNKRRMDWYRLIGVYILATIGVPISIRLGPSEGGFNRIIGFGILVHNAAELMILGHIWFGDVNNPKASNSFGAMWILMYVWVIMAMISFVPEVALFYILMLQGAYCDWSLVGSFLYMGFWMDHDQVGGGDVTRKEMGCYGKLGAAAAITHILSIHPLFVAIASSWLPLAGATIALLIPTFILYIWFTAADKHHRPVVIQPKVSETLLLNVQRNRLLSKMEGELKHRPQSGDGGSKDKHQADSTEYPLVGAVVASVDEIEKNAADMLRADRNKMDKNETEMKGDDEDQEEVSKLRTYGDIIRIGLLNIGDHQDRLKNSKWMKILAVAAFLVDVADVTIIFFLPCMINFVPTVCG